MCMLSIPSQVHVQKNIGFVNKQAIGVNDAALPSCLETVQLEYQVDEWSQVHLCTPITTNFKNSYSLVESIDCSNTSPKSNCYKQR